ncbi:MAG: hypothetical protein HYY93_14005 [Planctomycetes bacterium]|nr:hypothetical protein [Planctomycetota bacterium]
MSLPVLQVRKTLNPKCDIPKLRAWLQTKPLESRDTEVHPVGVVKEMSWRETAGERWNGRLPHLELVYEERNGFLLTMAAEIQNPGTLSATFVSSAIRKELEQAGVLGGPAETATQG